MCTSINNLISVSHNNTISINYSSDSFVSSPKFKSPAMFNKIDQGKIRYAVSLSTLFIAILFFKIPHVLKIAKQSENDTNNYTDKCE